MSNTKQNNIDWINKEFALEMSKLDAELVEYKKSIDAKREKLTQIRDRELAFLDIQFLPEWNNLITQGVRIAYGKSPAYFGRKMISGDIPLDVDNKENNFLLPGIEGIDVATVIRTMFESISKAATPAKDSHGATPERAVINLNVSHDLFDLETDDFRIPNYQVWMEKSENSLSFLINTSWISKSILPPN